MIMMMIMVMIMTVNNYHREREVPGFSRPSTWQFKLQLPSYSTNR